MIIDFEHFQIKKNMASKELVMCDVRENFANVLYRGGNGIRAHALALKIFNSEGPTDYNYEEYMLIKGTSEVMCTPAFIDGLKLQLDTSVMNEKK